MLFWESKLIHKLRGKTAVPNLHFVGDEKTEDGKMFHVMVMDLLGKSLEDLFSDTFGKVRDRVQEEWPLDLKGFHAGGNPP